MKANVSVEEQRLLSCIARALSPNIDEKKSTDLKEQEDEPLSEEMLELAHRHVVLPFLYERIEESLSLEEFAQNYYIKLCRQTVMTSYRLLFYSKYLVQLLESQDIQVVVLKGPATAAFYPMPELRKSGDIDLLIPRDEDLEKACQILSQEGIPLAEEQHANHHVVYRTWEGIDIELHNALSEPFDEERINRQIEQIREDCGEHIIYEEVMGVRLPVLDLPYHAYELLLHMLQHFLRSGFGLKLLCDWVVIWRRKWNEQEIQKLQELVRSSNLLSFTEMITSLCVQYLGLDEKAVPFKKKEEKLTRQFMIEILEAEEFGHSEKDRMVVMRGTRFVDYVREFHHQMRLTYPRAGRIVLLWPILWVSLFVGFLHRNRTVRGVSTKEIMRKAKLRSALAKELHLFSETDVK